jgi:hypothetical protein
MNYPCRWLNTQTGKTFKVKKVAQENGWRIVAEQEDGHDHGHAEYESQPPVCFFDHVESHPEAGSGLGSLLFFLSMTETSLDLCTDLKVSAAAMTARDFYLKMGCTRDFTVIDQPIKANNPPPAVEVWPGIRLSPSPSLPTEQFTPLARGAPIIGNVAHCRALSGDSTTNRWRLLGE